MYQYTLHVQLRQLLMVYTEDRKNFEWYEYGGGHGPIQKNEQTALF